MDWRQQIFDRRCDAKKDVPLAHRWPLLLDAHDPEALRLVSPFTCSDFVFVGAMCVPPVCCRATTLPN